VGIGDPSCEHSNQYDWNVMPVRKVKSGYKWGKTGKVYKTKAAALRQGKAIRASGYKKR